MVMGSIPPWLSTIIGNAGSIIAAVLTFVIGRAMWTRLKLPQLKLKGLSSISQSDPEIPDEMEGRRIIGANVVEINIKNEGRSAAESCKPEIEFISTTETSRRIVSGTIFWSEVGRPNRVDINRAETARAQILRKEEYETRSIVRFASKHGWPASTAIVRQKHTDEDTNNNRIQELDNLKKIGVEDFLNSSFEKATVRITSKNARGIEADIGISEAEESDSDIIFEIKKQRRLGGLL